ncbi:DUF4190 domain-containing protein [Amycolatopsis acidicola]|uniref:DUF4190 domain-containing protein n=1 Tax=Amycolatopsis acidicola TaxID=2596893 RepID=UPI001FB73705|nr:DUF4190 domain-containing protein [Amycolatopsis acidicola]
MQPPGVFTRPVEYRNGPGTAGFVLGLAGAIFSVIPIIGVIAWPLVILGAVFGAVGVARVRKDKANNTGLAIAGLVLSVLGLIICVLWVLLFTHTQSTANDRTVTVHYGVTGTANDATVSYSLGGDGTSSTSQEQVPHLPWSKDVSAKGEVKSGSLTVTAGQAGGEVTCTVSVDGKQAKTATASGPFAKASCQF